MKATRTVRSVLVLSVLGSLLYAQTPAPKKQEPPKKPEAVPTQPKEASAKPDASRELAFPVSGLTKDNLAKVKESLQALSMHVFTCASCKVEQAAAGDCPKCKAPLKSENRSDFESIQPSAEAGTIALTVDPKAVVKLSELESALGKNSIKIDPAKFPIAGRAHLVVKGVTADAAPAVEKALNDAKLFEEVKAKFDATTNELHVMVRAGASAPTRAKVTTAIESAKGTLADVVWGPMGGMGGHSKA